ncbi:zinc finger protein [Staphylococcus aureus]|nr:zinc finger protein [Staphylococcus aureus]
MPIVYGSLIDTETRCLHYFTEEDIIAIKFKCCNKYYPCYKCHNEFEKHAIKRWSEPSFNEKSNLMRCMQTRINNQ